MNEQMLLIIKIFQFVLFIGSIFWAIYQFDFEPLLATISSSIALLSMYYYEKIFTGSISGKILDETKPCILAIGGNIFSITIEQLQKSINVSDFLKKIGSFDGVHFSLPIKIYQENNRLFIDAELYDEENILIGKIVANNWEINFHNNYDKNSNLNAFEIVDNKCRPVFQVYLKEHNKIFIGGFVKQADKFAAFSPDQTTIGKDENLISWEAKRLFKYPSSKKKNQGVFEQLNLPRFLLADDKINFYELLKSKINEYALLSNIELKEKCIAIANEINQLGKSYNFSIQQIQTDREKLISQTQMALTLNDGSEDKDKILNEIRIKYQKEFSVDVVGILEAIRLRLPNNSLPELKNIYSLHKVEFYFSKIINQFDFERIENQMRRFAEVLPV